MGEGMARAPRTPPRFDARWNDRRRRAAKWNVVRWWLLLGALVAGALAGIAAAVQFQNMGDGAAGIGAGGVFGLSPLHGPRRQRLRTRPVAAGIGAAARSFIPRFYARRTMSQ